MQLRRHAVLEDGDLEGEVAIAQQTPVVRAALEIGGRRGFGGGRGRRLLAAGGKAGYPKDTR